MKHSIILIGPMGAGKTSIGRRLADLLALPFRDTDQVIRERAGVEIDFIFEKEGEPGFRERETRILRELVEGEPSVIATGGGIVLAAANRALLKQAGDVVFLETGIEWQVTRARRGSHRPLLDNVDPGVRLSELYAVREPLYRECASLTVNTDGRKVAAVTNSVIEALDARTRAGEK